jgi:sugar O-acyltransferase (sialic acid O-acetyltransferase NeuD family)
MKPQVVVVGGGGHAKVVIDILRGADEVDIIGYTDPGEHYGELCGCPYLGTDAILSDVLRSGVRYAFVAIGQNERRMGLFRSVSGIGFKFVNAISPRACLSAYAGIGEGIAVMPGAVVNAGACIGDGAIINTNASVDHDCVVGQFVHIGPGASLAGCVRLGEGAFLGAGCSIVSDIEIGGWTTVGAGTVVIRNLPPQVVAVGVPARIRRKI